MDTGHYGRRFKIKDEVRSGVLSGELTVMNMLTGEVMDVAEEVSVRIRSLNHSFVKTSLLLPDYLEGYTASERGYVHTIGMSIDKNGRVDFACMDGIACVSSVRNIRAKMRKSAIIDKLRLGNVFNWYANPYLFTKAKTCDPRLAKHFKERMTNPL